MIKPDGVARGLMGEILKRIEEKGLKITAMKLATVTKAQAEQLYVEHKGKPFYNGLIDFAISGPSLQMVVEGKECVSTLRLLVGATNPREATSGTIRGDFGLGLPQNVIHASDSPESTDREIQIFFKENEILAYERADDNYLGKE